MTDSFDESIQRAAELIKASKKAVVFTGAGISTPSGIPDFRSPGSGLWERYDPFEVASLSAFRHHPEKFYGWISPLVKTAKAAQPNQAHLCLARMEAAGFFQAIITQNIDGLHQKAGSKRVIELHGSAQTATCQACGRRYQENWLSEEKLDKGEYPHCEACGGVLKPDIILFEETLPVEAWFRAQMLCDQADVMLVVGSSLEVYPGQFPAGKRPAARGCPDHQYHHGNPFGPLRARGDPCGLDRNNSGALPPCSRGMISGCRACRTGVPAYPPINGSWSAVRADRCVAIGSSPGRAAISPALRRTIPARL